MSNRIEQCFEIEEEEHRQRQLEQKAMEIVDDPDLMQLIEERLRERRREIRNAQDIHLLDTDPQKALITKAITSFCEHFSIIPGELEYTSASFTNDAGSRELGVAILFRREKIVEGKRNGRNRNNNSKPWHQTHQLMYSPTRGWMALAVQKDGIVNLRDREACLIPPISVTIEDKPEILANTSLNTTAIYPKTVLVQLSEKEAFALAQPFVDELIATRNAQIGELDRKIQQDPLFLHHSL